jgi:hypothetical protein
MYSRVECDKDEFILIWRKEITITNTRPHFLTPV